MTDHELAKLSYKQLLALNGRIEAAIRAAIRAKQSSKTALATPAEAEATPMDLERERDAWLAGRKSR